MNLSTTNRQSGIALIMVMVVVVVLSTLAFGFAYSMKVETTLARHAMFTTELDWAGRSGIEIAKWVLAEESKGQNAMFDSLRSKWAGGPGDSNSPLAHIDLKNYPLERPDGSVFATVSIEIIDNDRKFNVNTADEIQLKEALTVMGVDAGAMASIVGSIQDWRDPDKHPHMDGAETDYYESLPEPYYCNDGPFDEITELLRVKGVTPNMFHGGGAGSSASYGLRGRRRSEMDEPTYAIGLKDIFTCLSGRLVNVNTASAKVLEMMFPEFDSTVTEGIIRERSGPDGAPHTDDDTPFRTGVEIPSRVPQLQPLLQNPAAAQQMMRYFTVRSLVFEVHVNATIASTKRDYVGVLRRNHAKDIQTLNLYWK